MTLLHFDSVGGASGDMILAALIDMGVDCARLQKSLAPLGVGRFTIEARPASESGLHGTRVRVAIPDRHNAHGHEHRDLEAIRKLIRGSRLPKRTRDMSVAVFQRLAEAEARVHRTKPDRVHFHEVGAVDSIVDIVGACLCLTELDVHDVAVTPLPAGYGTTLSRHGVIPVPAPATVELLKGFPIIPTDEVEELVTPTAAALLTTWKTMALPPAGSRILKTGHGFGHRKLKSRPNLLRVHLLDTPAADHGSHDECLVLECNIDDMQPELVAPLVHELLAAGALDAFLTPVQMKKQRPATLITALCRPDDRDCLLDIFFRESTTFGVREHLTRRTMLDRRHVTVRTPYGAIRVKVGTWQGRDVTHSPEYDDCAARAEVTGAPLKSVYAAAIAAPIAEVRGTSTVRRTQAAGGKRRRRT